MIKIKTDFLVLGAGWSGLVAADILSKRFRKHVILLEKEGEAGGLARTLNFNGFKFDIGGHALFLKNSKNMTYIESFAGRNTFLRLKRSARILFDHKYVIYPPSISSLAKINKKLIVKIIFEMFKLRKKEGKKNFEEWVKSNYGECLYEIYFKNYTEKVWGTSCDRLASAWAESRIGNNDWLQLMASMFIGRSVRKENRRLFFYPRYGIGMLPDLLEGAMRGGPCQIFRGVQLKKIVMLNGRPAALSLIAYGRLYEISFKQLISSIPIAELLKIFPDDYITVPQEIARGLRYRDLILVSLIVNKKLVTDWHWCYFPSKEVIFSRIHEPKFWSQSMAANGAKTLLCAEIFCNKDDLYWNMSQQEMERRIREGLVFTGLLRKNDIILDVVMKKIEYAYPFHYEGFEKSLNRTKVFFRNFKNLHLVGRSGTHSYFDMEECLEDVVQKIETLSH